MLKVSIEAGVTCGWERYTGSDGLTIGLDRFGASAPAEVLFKHFGFSAEAIVPKIKDKLGKLAGVLHMATKVAINGFGRIGRLVARAILERTDHDLELVAINDLADRQVQRAAVRATIRTHGRFPGTVTSDGDSIQVNGKRHRGHQGARSGQAAAQGHGRRPRARMHRLLPVATKRAGRISMPAPSAC